jgi:hypothetical protein
MIGSEHVREGRGRLGGLQKRVVRVADMLSDPLAA